jgi:hypothetical protein
MSSYIKLSTLEYPRHEGDIRLEYPEITEDQTGDAFPYPDWAYAKVIYVSPPEVEDTQLYYEIPPVLREDGMYYMTWEVRDLTQEENERRILIIDNFNTSLLNNNV